MQLFIILPAFNEESGLPLVLETIRGMRPPTGYAFQVVVVDDGSADRTSDIARSYQSKLPLHLITFPHNQGVAEVFRQGFQYVCQASTHPDRDIAVVLDSDNTQDPKVLLKLVAQVEAGLDVVIASRFEGEGRMIGCPWSRSLLSYGASWLLRTLVRLPGIKDYSTFYRAYRISVLQQGFAQYGDTLLEGKGFSVAAGLLMKLGNITRRMGEVPLILRYDLKRGSSGNKIMKTITGYLLLLKTYILTGGFAPTRKSHG